MSPTLLHTAELQRKLWPQRWFRPDNRLHRSILQELFWQAAALVVTEICTERDALLAIELEPGTVIDFPRDLLARFSSEIGLERGSARKAANMMLSVALLGEPTPPAPLLALGGKLPPPALGLVLLTLHLAHIDPTQDGAFDYQHRELTRAARRHLRWLPIGPFDDGLLGRRLFGLAGIRGDQPPSSLVIPYSSYYKPLFRRVETTLGRPLMPVKINSNAAPIDLFTTSTPCAPPNNAVEILPEATTTALRNRLDVLLSENDQLRATDASDHLEILLDPLLRLHGDWLAQLETTAIDCRSLAADLMAAYLRVLRRPEVEFFEEPGAHIIVSMPNALYKLDAAAPQPSRGAPSDRYLVTRRGVRLHGRTVLPARIIPRNGGLI